MFWGRPNSKGIPLAILKHTYGRTKQVLSFNTGIWLPSIIWQACKWPFVCFLTAIATIYFMLGASEAASYESTRQHH